MLLNAIIIVLREVLEAALLISLLSSVSASLHVRHYWIVVAFVLGSAGAFLYAANLPIISELFEYTGQEILNVLILTIICSCLTLFVVFSKSDDINTGKARTINLFLMVVPVALAITLEGSEIAIYLSGFLQSGQKTYSVLVGSAIGAGIGVSIGALIYFALVTCKPTAQFLAVKITLTVIAAGILSQAVALLLQADILSSSTPLWDTSNFLSEESVVGQLLYAVMGYEATPAPQQVVIYVVVMAGVALGAFIRSSLSVSIDKKIN